METMPGDDVKKRKQAEQIQYGTIETPAEPPPDQWAFKVVQLARSNGSSRVTLQSDVLTTTTATSLGFDVITRPLQFTVELSAEDMEPRLGDVYRLFPRFNPGGVIGGCNYREGV
jgi:hypothetical protein